MKPVRRFEGLVAPLLRANVDTDAIIPSREMKRVSKQGLAEGLFAGWRYHDASTRDNNPDFVLNQSAYQNASILVAGPNFGCGSSREHAVWALKEYGFRAILAPSFGAIFERNCFNNGVLPLSVAPADLERILSYTESAPSERVVTVDLERQQLTWGNESPLAFEVPDAQRDMLLHGWDPIDRTLQMSGAIDAFFEADQERRPWVYENPSADGP